MESQKQTPKLEDAENIPDTEWAMSGEDIQEIFLASCSPDIRAMFAPRPEKVVPRDLDPASNSAETE